MKMDQVKYQCSEDHEFSAPSNVKLKKCPYCIDGKPCSGKVERALVGAAARYDVCEGSNQRFDHDGRRGTDKVKCGVCGKRVAVKKDGKLRNHGNGKPPTKALEAKGVLVLDDNGLSANDRSAIKEISDLLVGAR